MGLLDTLGLRKKKARPVGQDLESGRSDAGAKARNDLLLRIGLFVALLVATVAAFPRGEVYEYTVQVGDTWRQPTLVAPFNFPVYKNPASVAVEREKARGETPPFFEAVPNARERMDAKRDTLREQLQQVFDAYASFRYHELRGQMQDARDDSLRYRQLRRATPLVISDSQWRTLVDAYAGRLDGLARGARSSRAATEGPRLDQRLLDAAYDVGAQLLRYGNGVLNLPLDSIPTDDVIVRNEVARTQQRVEVKTVYGLNEAYAVAEERLEQDVSNNPAWSRLAFSMFRDLFVPSLRYQRAETLRERERRARNVLPTRGGIEKGEVVVQKGERITEEVKRKLTSLERAKNERTATNIVWKQATGELLLALGAYGFFFLYLYLIRREIYQSNRDLLLIVLLFGLIVGLYALTVRLPWANLYAVPVALVAVQLTIVFNSTVGLLGTLALAFIGGAMVGLDLEYGMASFLGGTLGVFSVRDIKNRGQFVISALLVFLGHLVVLAASWLYLGAPASRLGEEVFFAAIGSSFIITSYLVLWGLERVFDITTDLTLLELSDTNRPVLKRLSLEAPGSFNHSLQVANLAEAAADRIGADALLVRVGALYHDIGKMKKPEYFVENQRGGQNPHDKLKPRMCALIIASHVKEGAEMAKQEGLPKAVMHFIPTHHGTSRIEYFYRQAVQARGEEEAPVMESEFRYPGPRPDSKETGILMMADSIEAASRSLDEPTHKRLKGLIELIVKERVEDGQLDDTDLTFRDLTQIKETFLSMLTGIYHVRVKYPDQEETLEVQAPRQDVMLMGTPEEEHDGVSIFFERDVWGTPEQSVSATQLMRVAGVSRPPAPRPSLAEASPHHRPANDARADAPGERPADAPPTAGGAPAGGGAPATNGAAETPEAKASEHEASEHEASGARRGARGGWMTRPVGTT